MHSIPHQFTERKVSSYGGIKYIQQTYERCGLKGFMPELNLSQPGSNRGYDPIDLVEGFMVSSILGAKRLSHTGMLRQDQVIAEIFGWDKGMGSQSTFSRFFNKFSFEDNDELFPRLQKWWFSQFENKQLTIDIDSTVLTRYGTQGGVKTGYNPTKPGRGSHHPIMAFAAELEMVVNAWQRTGNSASSTQFDEFLDEVFEIVEPKRVGLVRADSGFYGKPSLQALEEYNKDYIIRCKLNAGLVAKIRQQNNWWADQTGRTKQEYTSFYYQASGWDQARRIVVSRRPKEGVEPEELLFDEYADFELYEYYAVVTSKELSCELIMDLYNKRADAENRIKELKYDYGIDGFCLKDFAATEAAFRWVIVAYNLMALFKQNVIKGKKNRMLSTIKFQCIAIGSYLTSSGRQNVLNMAATGEKRQFLEKLFRKLDDWEPPNENPNA